MLRLVVSSCFVSLILFAVGCRICTSPCDYRISAFIDRCDDYRGSNPMYRAGSISGGWCGTHQVVRGAVYERDYGDYYSNAGNYGVTTPVSMVPHTPPHTDTLDYQPDITHPNWISKPPQLHNEGGILPPVFNGLNGVPNIEELIDRQLNTIPFPTPITPPIRPRTPPSETMPSDVIPFSPSDAQPIDGTPTEEKITPPRTLPTIMETDGPPITLEELRRLDPSIQDVQIISIEDVSSVR